MIRIIFVCICLACCANCQLRIVNGESNLINDFMVSVIDAKQRYFCTGTILNMNHILTSAHCFCGTNSQTRPFSIQYSFYMTLNGDSIAIDKEICHDNFTDGSKMFDVAVLKLVRDLPKGEYTPVQLAEDFKTINFRFGRGVILGWGPFFLSSDYPKILKKLEVTIYPDFICHWRGKIDHIFCTGKSSSGICESDAGAALLVNGVQVGIASFFTAKKCGKSNMIYPDVFASVPFSYNWIMEKAIL